MARHIEENERIKRDYTLYLRDAKGQDHKSIDKALAAIRRFEESTKCKPFKKFHRLQAPAFKDYLTRAKNANGKVTWNHNSRFHIASGEGILSLAGQPRGVQTSRVLCGCGILQQHDEGRSCGSRAARYSLSVDGAMCPCVSGDA